MNHTHQPKRPPAECPVFYDPRWTGQHGIARFAQEITARLPGAIPLAIAGRHLSPVDPLAITAALWGKRCGVYFSPGFNPPLASPIPFAFTIHDLIPLHFPGESTALRRLFYNQVVKPATHRAHCVFTVSEHAKSCILEWANLDPNKVVVISNAPAKIFSPDGDRYQSDTPYFLHVGRRASHKNIPLLLTAFTRLRMRNVKLVFTGDPDRKTQELINKCRLDARVCFSGPISDGELARLYRGATALTFPSSYEGFGLPVLEAMACGTPVITSSHPALVETAGSGNAIFVSHDDGLTLANAMEELLDASDRRSQLRERGIARASGYSWDASASVVASKLSCSDS